tara:strand:- start:310 stop:840 length:531 start_codon:yes stop_codon:yes gene_type:complete
MKVNKGILALLIFVFVCCKEDKRDRENINNRQSELKSEYSQPKKQLNDTIILDLNLTMEWAVRKDSLILIKNKDSITINGLVKQKIEGVDKNYKISHLKPKNYYPEEDSTALESLINKYKKKTKNGDVYLLKRYKKNDTLILFSDNLKEKNDFIQEYFKIMRKIYPDSKLYYKFHR